MTSNNPYPLHVSIRRLGEETRWLPRFFRGTRGEHFTLFFGRNFLYLCVSGKHTVMCDQEHVLGTTS